MTTVTVDNAVSKVDAANRPRLLTFLFGFCMFSTGGTGLVNEYVLATMTTYILGNSIEQFSIIIAAMMLMMGLSGVVQEKMSDNNLIQKFMGVEMLMAILGGFAPIAIYAAFGYMTEHFIFVHYFFVLSIGFLIGFEIPIVMRIIDQYGVGIKKNLRTVYAMDYIGAFVFALVWVFFLLKHFPLPEISFIVASFNFIVATITVLYFIYTGVVKTWKVPVIFLVGTTVALIYGYQHNRDWTLTMEQKFYEDPIVHVETTKYQHLVLTQHPKTKDVRLYINGNTQFSSLDEKRYHDLLVHPAMSLRPRARNILILGGGDGLALREILKYQNVDSVTLVDLDPAMVKFASTDSTMCKLNDNSFSDARVFTHKTGGVQSVGAEGVYIETGRTNKVSKKAETEFVAQIDVYNVDADRFVGELHNGRKWDVIIIDFPDPSSVELSKLYSREFYKKLQWLMADNAVVSIQSTSPYHAKEAYLAIGKTMESAGLKVIPYRQNIPAFGDWGYYLSWTSDESVADMKQKIQHVSKFQVETNFITPEVMVASMAFGKGELSPEKQCVNTLMRPCLLDLYEHYGWQND